MLLTILYLIGITAEAMTGALSATRRGMDLFGIVLVACATALGGGSIRDIVLGHYPLTWIEYPKYIIITSIAAIIAMLFTPIIKRLNILFLTLDAIGLVTFTIMGCQISLHMGHKPIIVILSGVITGIFGGIIRDIFCNDIPLVFKQELYASISFLSAGCYLCCIYFNLSTNMSIVITLIFGLTLRMLAIHYHWKMPKKLNLK